jgi:hypothetical protein
MANIKASAAETRGEVVTTISNQGGIGLGRLVDGIVYVSAGNGFYTPAADRPGGLKEFRRDAGEGYAAALDRLRLPPVYQRRA